MGFRFRQYLPLLARTYSPALATVSHSHPIDFLGALPPYTTEITLKTRHKHA